MSRTRWVRPDINRIVKFLPNNPPERGDVVLVDGERCRVLRCPVEWDDRTWRMVGRGVKVKPEPSGGSPS